MIGLELIAACAATVAPATVQQVIWVESKGNPLAIGVNGGRLPRKPTDAADAAALARAAISQGYSVDLGLMQVNSSNLARLGYSVEDMFDQCKNLAAGSKVLTDFYVSARRKHGDDQTALRAALSAYNTGSYSRGFSNGYVGKYLQPSGRPNSRVSVSYVADIVRREFGARITDAERPANASYGARNSYHKHGQAIDFVPAAGLNSINRSQIRSVLMRYGIRAVELLGPGDRGHSDHWHLAFAVDGQPANPAANPMLFASADARPAANPYTSSSVVFIRGQETTTMQNPETTKPVISTNEADASTPGVQIEHTAESAEQNGAFEETAMTEADAWESNTDLHATAIMVAGVRVGTAKE